MEDYYEYLDSNGVTTLYKLIKDDTVALIDSYSVTINGITTNLDNHVNNSDIHTPISDIENMVDTKISGLVNSAPETLDTLKELSDALGNDPNFATTVANQIGNKASKDDVYTKQETDTLLDGKANSVHSHVVSDITDFPTIPTKVSELSNDSNFVTSTELHDYATKNDLNSKQDVLSEEQLSNIDSIPDKANKSDLSTVATSGSYKDLLDKPVIPEGADLSDYYNKGETDNLLNSKANTSDLAVVAKSGNYSDLINTPTIPTKLSQLENDMGFGSGSGGVITSISWTNITDKPNFATVATSGSYNDLSNTPTIPTKVSQLENDTGFINTLTDVVYTKSNQTINGIKTFTASPIVSNNATTNGYFIKLNAIARNDVPSQLYHATFRALDKNSKILGEYCIEKSNSGSTLAQINVRSEDANGKQISRSVYFNMSNDGTKTAFYPNVNNVIDLGMSNYKWANAYINKVVCTRFTHSVNNGSVYITGGSEYDKGATLVLHGEESSDAGSFIISSRDKTRTLYLVGKPDGTLQWAGQNIALDENLVHTSGTETINGIKTFTQDIILKDNNIDLTVTPSSTLSSNFIFKDKNNQNVSFIQYAKRDTEPDVLGLYIHDKSKNLHGIQITSNNYLLPIGNNIYNLGSPNNKWAKIYSDDVVHTSGNETISGSKTFSNQIYLGAGGGSYGLISAKDNNSILRLFGGTSPSTGANLDLYGEGLSSGGFSLRARTSDKIVSLDGKVDGTLKWNGKNVALDENLVHRSGDEYISGTKMFSNIIHRYADLTTSGGAQVYRFDDTNANSCGHIYNNAHWAVDTIINSVGAYNNKSGKTTEIHIVSNDAGGGMAYIEGDARKGNLETVTSATGHTGIATMGWVNNPATSTNVVHRSGDETIAGTKTFSNTTISNKELHYKDTKYDWTDKSLNTWNDAGHVAWFDKTGNRRMHELVGANGGVWRKACYINENEYFSVDSNRNISFRGTTTFNGNLNANKFIGNLQGNADTATYSPTPATSDNSTRIATTAWVRNYVNSVVGSGSIGASISAYYSDATTLTATGNSSSSGGPYPSDYSDYINISPKVGTIYTGSQLFSSFTPTASGTIFRPPTGSGGTAPYLTTAKATANFSGAFSPSAKYLCTTANAVRFRAYVSQGTNSSMGSPSVVDNSSTKSIFIRVQ